MEDRGQKAEIVGRRQEQEARSKKQTIHNCRFTIDNGSTPPGPEGAGYSRVKTESSPKETKYRVCPVGARYSRWDTNHKSPRPTEKTCTMFTARSFIAAVTAVLISSQILVAQDNSYQSYLAHVAAANASLRLNEAAEAKRWIASAPAEHRGWEWEYLSGRVENSLRAITFDGADPRKIRFSPSGDAIAAAMSDGTVRIVDPQSGEELQRLTGHQQTVYDVRYSPDARTLVSCSRDGTVRLWSTGDGKELWQSKGGGQGIASVAYSPDGTTIGYTSWHRKESVVGLVVLFDAASGKELWRTGYDVKPIVDIEFSSDGKYFAIGTWNWRVAVWDVSRAELVRDFDYNDVPVYSAIDDITFSADGKHVAAASKSDDCPGLEH